MKKSIGRNPAVVLLGARQVGKTTLSKYLARNLDSIYLDLEDTED
ncbi:MAG: AAA family ATPase [Paracoccaceae bacterium]|nr:AAA family ATPase [Paracoccaceae bacterium]